MPGFFQDDDDPFGLPPAPGGSRNAPPEYSVGELSQKLKRVVEGEFSFVRVRGEISKVTLAKSGHLYTALKDADAVLDAVCWKGTVARLGIRPEEGMEVVCTGRLTTYPGRSNYQLIIETMELAGQGALLKMLEERKKKLAAEGLFDPARKKKIPFLPEIIGVVTSPTGAVIRDILHRVSERFPRHVLVWPVVVQGQGAAAQVAAAIQGFNALTEKRPDVIIVARGGGSLEDLMPFNDEIVVRAAAASKIPLISAVGHETDTTLIDFASDLRAPTPTAAAEKAVPVRAELMAQVMDGGKRLFVGARRLVQHQQVRVEGLARGLGDPRRLLENVTQKLDHLSLQLDAGLKGWLERRAAKLRELSARLSPSALQRQRENMAQKLGHLSAQLDGGLRSWVAQREGHVRELSARLSPRALSRRIADSGRIVGGLSERLGNTEKKILAERSLALQSLSALLESLSFERVLDRGYAVVSGPGGEIISSAQDAQGDVEIRFRDGRRTAQVKT